MAIERADLDGIDAALERCAACSPQPSSIEAVARPGACGRAVLRQPGAQRLQRLQRRCSAEVRRQAARALF